MPSPIPGQNYTVISGDLLWRISARAYGLASKWQKIISANPQLLGRKKAVDGSPLIFPGDVLYIPPDEEKKQIEARIKENRFRNNPKEKVTVVINSRELPVMSDASHTGLTFWRRLITAPSPGTRKTQL
jgi:LysM repeat protein